MQCDRCDALCQKEFYYSWFNADRICKKCRSLEESDENYASCREAEHEAVLRGDYNFSFSPNYGKKKKEASND